MNEEIRKEFYDFCVKVGFVKICPFLKIDRLIEIKKELRRLR